MLKDILSTRFMFHFWSNFCLWWKVDWEGVNGISNFIDFCFARPFTVSIKSSQDSCPVFRVCGVKLGDKAACGGALILKDGTIRAMFSGPVTCMEWFGSDITAIIMALNVLKLAGWDKTREVAVESENKILLNWLANSLQRHWGLSKLLAEVDVLACDLSIQFRHILNDQNELATYLARDGLTQVECFQAWW
ncbi:hypothetical protein V6N13_069470 [Hibiscus sabdariffa]